MPRRCIGIRIVDSIIENTVPSAYNELELEAAPLRELSKRSPCDNLKIHLKNQLYTYFVRPADPRVISKGKKVLRLLFVLSNVRISWIKERKLFLFCILSSN